MGISKKLLCLFTATVTRRDDRYIVEIPRQEIDMGTLEPDGTYRVAVLAKQPTSTSRDQEPVEKIPGYPQPPVEIGEIRYVEIEDIGKQGDGIARVERGYVIIVPGAAVGERVKIEITEVKPNFAVGETVEEVFE